MENQHLINGLLAGGFTVLGWFARELWAADGKMYSWDEATLNWIESV